MSRTIGVEIIGDASSVNRSFASASRSARTFEKDLGRSTRGALAGTGVFRSLGRSLAFASGSFLAISGVSAAITDSIKGAENLAKAQAGLAVAVEHTGGNLGKLIPKYTAVAKAAADFGMNQADATTALERATVLTGSAARAQRAYQEALVISKATGKDFNAVLVATSKGQAGITTSLKRYGIQIAAGTKGTEQFSTVMSRFGGQAKANTDATDRLRAVLANTEETIGTALLPTVDKYLTKLGDWLEKMEKSGRLQHDVNVVVHDGAAVFHVIGDAIHDVDKVTGSFVHTLELLAAFKLASLVTGWVSSLGTLATQWGLVGAAATKAGAAQTAAMTEAGVASRVGMYTAAGAAATARNSRFLAGASGLGLAVGGGALALSDAATPPAKPIAGFKVVASGTGGTSYIGPNGNYFIRDPSGKVTDTGVKSIYKSVVKFTAADQPRQPGGSRFTTGGSKTSGSSGSKKAPYKSFGLTVPEQIAQARAGLTKGTGDDVAAAKQVIARIKRLMGEGKLSGKSLLQALQAEGAAMNTLQSAQAAAAQKAAAAAQAQIQNMIDPIRLEVQLSKDQALGRSTLADLRALKASAEKALASGKLTWEQQKEAYDQITSLNAQIAQAAKTATVAFSAPAKLQLALAKDAALGKSSTKDLLKLKAAILKFIRTHKNNIAALTDAYNQLAAVNGQLGATAQSALGLFKQASTKKLTANLGLTPAQRRALRARLSQLGPGGTVPGSGVGADGFVINPRTGKPIKVKAPPRLAGRSGGGGSGGGDPTIDLNVYIDGKHVEATVTKRQQRRGRRNPHQRRGPHAG